MANNVDDELVVVVVEVLLYVVEAACRAYLKAIERFSRHADYGYSYHSPLTCASEATMDSVNIIAVASRRRAGAPIRIS